MNTNNLVNPPIASISLLGKWMPTENCSNSLRKSWARKFMAHLNMSPKEYRQNISQLRNYLEVVETRMSSNNWQAIDYEKVPSKANLIYKNAFMRHDPTRRQLYLDALDNGDAKINSSVTFPYEIVAKYCSDSGWNWCGISKIDVTLENMWKSLPNLIQDGTKTLCVKDDSGSMFDRIPNSSATCLDVADAISIYFAERCTGPYQNLVMTFSSRPQFIKINTKGNTLKDKINHMRSHSEYSNTNIEAVFDLILKTAVEGNYKQEDLPDNILILSDGGFDVMTSIGYQPSMNKSIFDNFAQRFAFYGYKMPKLIYWDIMNQTGTIPFGTHSDFPCILVSGFSANTFKMVQSNCCDPWLALVEALLDKRYDAIEIAAFRYLSDKTSEKSKIAKNKAKSSTSKPNASRNNNGTPYRAKGPYNSRKTVKVAKTSKPKIY